MRWNTVKLADVADVIRGVSFDNSETVDYVAEGTLPILRAGNIQQEVDIFNDLVWVPIQRVSKEQLLKKGDILIAMSSGSITIVGKTAQMEHDWNGSVGAFCAIVRPKEGVHQRFLHFYLRGPQFSSWRQSAGIGLNIKNLRRSELENFPIPLPPLAEQRRIVEILDRADALRKLRREADAIAERILPALFYKMFGDPVRNEKGWKVGPLADICTEDKQVVSESEGNELPYVGLEHVEGNTGRLLIDVESAKKIEVRGNSFLFDHRNVLYGKLRPYLNKVYLPSFLGRCTTELVPLLPNKSARREFIAMLLRTQFIVSHMMSTNKGSRMPRTDMSLLMSMRVYQPPFELQTEFANLHEQITHLKESLSLSSENLGKLFSSLLHRAFTGELTKRWREEETLNTKFVN